MDFLIKYVPKFIENILYFKINSNKINVRLYFIAISLCKEILIISVKIYR